MIDGLDVRSLKINTLRSRMAVVSQDTFIFDTTVRENIIYGMNGSDRASDEKVYEAAQTANALDFILGLTGWIQYGFRAIAASDSRAGKGSELRSPRALLRNPDILILDEATSALDSITEKLIQSALAQLSKGRTVIAIAHRLSTIAEADKVVVMEKGRIVEQGQYLDLLETRGKLWGISSKCSLKELTFEFRRVMH